MKNNAGFTLIELLVVVLIIGILAAMAMPQYFKAVERSRMAEAETLLNSLAHSQRRKVMQTNKITTNFAALDVAPKNASGNVFETKGDGKIGFFVQLAEDGRIIATRDGEGGLWNGPYAYDLTRYYYSDYISCRGRNEAGKEICADFCGIGRPVYICCNDGTTSTCQN